MKVKSILLAAAGLLAVVSMPGHAAIISCTGIAELTGPVAPAECFQENAGGGSQDNLAWILGQSAILDGSSGLEKADKTDEGSTKPGYVLSLTDLGITEDPNDGDNIITFDSEGYTHSFDVDGPDGTFLDYMVISWKQAGLLTGALFQNVILDVDGLLFSINANANEGVLSHGSLHVAEGTPTTSVPEPGMLALLGMGLLGLAAFRGRRKS